MRGAARRLSSARGGVLLELLVSIAIFVAAATFTLSALGTALDGTRRAELRARAADLADSRLAELDAGLVSIGELGDAAAGSSDSALEVGATLEVVVTIVSGAEGRLATARATVTDRSGAEPVVVCVRERLVTLEAPGAGSAR
jgi:hypothetical protein